MSMSKGSLENLSLRPKGMAYKGYADACKAAGVSAMDEDAYKAMDEGDEDGEGDNDDAEKGDLAIPDLMKALADYDAIEKGLDQGMSRKDHLRARMVKGTITDDEEREYGRLLSGDGTNGGGTQMTKSLTEAVGENDEDGLIDASPFLKSLVDGIGDRLESMGNASTAEHRRNRDLTKAQGSLLKAMVHTNARQARVINELEKRLGIVEKTPVRPRAVTSRAGDVRDRDMNKGGAAGGGDSRPDQLSKSDVRRGLELLVKGAAENNDDAAIQQLSESMAHHEAGRAIPPNVLAAVRRAVA